MALTMGFLHPGEMGTAVAAAVLAGGARAVWASEGRSPRSHQRAEGVGLVDVATIPALVRQSDVVLSVCPPAAALELAREVAALRFTGLYVDANAVSPATARDIGAVVEGVGATFVDGGIVGPPPQRPGTTRLYLSGPKAQHVAAAFATGPLEAVVLDGGPGAASALKMAYAGWTKGSSALLLAVRTLAVSEGIDEALLREWARSLPDLPARSEAAVRGTAPKAWRFVGEMEEISATFAAAGLPEGFHQAAAEIYRRLAPYKDAPSPPSLAEAAHALSRGPRP